MTRPINTGQNIFDPMTHHFPNTDAKATPYFCSPTGKKEFRGILWDLKLEIHIQQHIPFLEMQQLSNILLQYWID